MRTDRRGEEGVVIRERDGGEGCGLELLLNACQKIKKNIVFQHFSESGLGPWHVARRRSGTSRVRDELLLDCERRRGIRRYEK